jgi:hypothetical protein
MRRSDLLDSRIGQETFSERGLKRRQKWFWLWSVNLNVANRDTINYAEANTVEMKFVKQTAGYARLDYKRNADIMKELNA